MKDVRREPSHLEYIIGCSTGGNVDPYFMQNRFFEPLPVRPVEEMAEAGYSESWVTYSTQYYSAKELTVFPGRSVTVTDAAAYGLIVTQGRGSIGVWDVHTPAMVRYGEQTADEYFVTAGAAGSGVRITNASPEENLVMLKHFGPDNLDARALER